MSASIPFLQRRAVLLGGAALALPGGRALAAAPAEQAYASSPFRKIADAEWRRRLPAASYGVLRHEDTERPFSSPLNREHRRGAFVCLGCGLPLFRSEWKFDSGTGWPSFWRVIDGAVGEKRDTQLFGEVHTEYHCARCLGHQGHVFDDGPRPTGLRYCNNGVALAFVPA